jgi:alkyldihydroxyacetonephosphate synthase
MVVSLDMTRMNKVKWVDRINQVACVEAGIYGVDLEKELKNYGVCCGHEPVYHIILRMIYDVGLI